MVSERARTVRRAFEILEVFSRLRRPLSLKDIVDELGYPSSSVADLLKTLSQIGCLAFDASSRTYFPTTRLAALGDWVVPEILPNSDPYRALAELRQETGETVMLGTLNDLEIQYLYVLEGPFGARYLQKPNNRRPLIKSGVGWIMLSLQDDESIERIYRRSIAAGLATRADTPFEALKSSIQAYRHQGYAVARDSINSEAALVAILLPRLWQGRPLAIAIGGPAERILANAARSAVVLQDRAERLAGMMDRARSRIGWIGCGLIGLPMVRRVAGQGWHVVASDSDGARRALTADAGVPTVDNVAQLGDNIDVVVLSLPHAEAVRQVLFGSGLVLRGRTVIDTSSMAPADAQAIARDAAEAGADFIDMPVSGGKDAAASGDLVAFIGGRAEVVERAMPLIQTMAARATHFGDVGAGQLAKAVNQAIVCGTIAVWHEAMGIARAGGLDLPRLFAALEGSGADSRVRAAFGGAIAAGTFTPSANLTKDIAVARGLAATETAPAASPLLEAVEDILKAMARRGQ